MTNYKAVIFDLDDTLINRKQAVNNLFDIILNRFYEDDKLQNYDQMIKKFKEYDFEHTGDPDKTKVLKPFFKNYPPDTILKENQMITFWNDTLPGAFAPDSNVLNLLSIISNNYKIAIITNGTTYRQKVKIKNSNLGSFMDEIIISEEVGISKPDPDIFNLTLDRLDVSANEAIFVGDNLELDVKGSQNAGLTDVWFNPYHSQNKTDVVPSYEIDKLESLLKLLE